MCDLNSVNWYVYLYIAIHKKSYCIYKFYFQKFILYVVFLSTKISKIYMVESLSSQLFYIFSLIFPVLILISNMHALLCIFPYAYTYMYGNNLLFCTITINFFDYFRIFVCLEKEKKLILFQS